MPNARENNKGGLTEYEQKRKAIIADNKRRLEALKIPSLSSEGRQAPTRKRTKRTHNKSDAASEGHNLRPRPKRNKVEIAHEEHIDEDLGYDSTGGFLSDNKDVVNSPQNKRKGRGITRLDDICARPPSMGKIKIMLNEYGQPIGDNSRRFSSFIGCQVRNIISVACVDWRLVDAEKKYEVWTTIKARYDVDDAAFKWFMDTAGKKWKEWKSTLKKLYFSGKLTDEELKKKHANRVNSADWKFLIDYWKTPQCQARTKVSTTNRGKLKLPHTSGSKSFARSRHELDGELGRPSRRDEVFVKTHTRKNGVPSKQAAPIINQFQDIIEEYPELKEKTIQQGDIYAIVCGEKEPRGRVRGLGLGPTPQDVGAPGLKSYAPTRLQMEVLARKKAESYNVVLEQRIVEMLAEKEEERMARLDVEIMSQNGSNSRAQTQSPRFKEHDDEAQSDPECDDDDQSDEDQFLLVNRHFAAPSVPPPNQSDQCSPINTNTSAPAKKDATRSPHDELVGKEVILYAVLRSELPVAKGTIVSTNPTTLVGGQPLGKQYCEVIVSLVLKRDAILPRPHAEMNNMGDALMMAIAWPYKKAVLKEMLRTRKDA